MDAILYNKVEEEANRIIRAIQQSGGGGNFLTDLTLTENQKAVQIEIPDNAFTEYNNIGCLILVSAESSADWFYASVNTTTTTLYQGLSSQLPLAYAVLLTKTATAWQIVLSNGNRQDININTSNYLYVQMYASDKFFGIGSKFILIGIN